MELFGISGFAAITVLCYLLGLCVKLSPLDDKFIPLICGTFGAALGAAGLYLLPDFPAKDLLTALAMGAVSGFAATGMDQGVKQLLQNK